MGIKYKVILIARAKLELDSIYKYISKFLLSPQAAKNFSDKFKNNILRLERLPKLCGIIEEYRNLKYEYRKLLINNYVAIYRVDENANTVYILRIIYSKTNYLSESYLLR